MIKRIFGFSVEHPKLIILLTLIVTILFLWQFPKIKIDTDPKHMLPTTSPVRVYNDEVDRLYDQVYRELLTFMLNDPRTIDRATWLIWVAHNLERIGDRVQNICERTVYEATGVMREFTREERPEHE